MVFARWCACFGYGELGLPGRTSDPTCAAWGLVIAAVQDNPKHQVILMLATGAKLLTVAELMAATGLGQTSVWKALNELEREGNVRRSPRKTAGRAELWQTTMTV
jgi:hypothetical protein